MDSNYIVLGDSKATLRLRNEKNFELIQKIRVSIDNYSASLMADCSDNCGTLEKIAIMTPYNINDNLNIYGIDKYKLFDFILKNRKVFESYENWGTGTDYDCSGKCFASSVKIKKCGWYMLIIKSFSYDV